MSSNKDKNITLPIIDYIYSLPDGLESIGLSNLYQDSDGVIRSFVTKVFEDNQAPDTTLGALLAKKAGFLQVLKGLNRIGYVGPPGTIPRFTFKDLVNPKESDLEKIANALKNKIVIISVERDLFSDSHLTPYAGGLLFQKEMKLMSGAEIHANIIESIITRRSPKNVPGYLRILWLLILVSAATFLSHIFGPRTGMISIIGMISVSGLFSYFMFLMGYLVPLMTVLLALMACYFGILGIRLTQEEKDRMQLENIFSPYVSGSVLRHILNSEKKPELGGEELEITVLFSDIRNFTTLSEKLNPKEIVEILNHYYALVCNLIIQHNGIIDKFIGDAVMAIFGAPVNFPDHARQCFETALGMVQISMDFKTWLKKRFPDKNIPEFKIGIGIHTGPALMGNIGSKQRMEYTAIGDTINIAARLEGMSKQLGWTIVASRESVNATQGILCTGRKELVQPRGRVGYIEVSEVTGIKNNKGPRKN